MRKSVAAATMAASLTLGGAASVALFTPTISSATTTVQDDGSISDAERPEPGERLAEILAPLVEDGTITQPQSDAVVDALVAARPEGRHGGPGKGHDRGHGPGAHIGDIVEELTGLNHGEIRSAFESGTTLRQLLEDNGSSGDAFVDAVTAGASERLAQAVENGRLTQEEADEKLAEIEARATAALDADQPRHPGHNGPDADDEEG